MSGSTLLGDTPSSDPTAGTGPDCVAAAIFQSPCIRHIPRIKFALVRMEQGIRRDARIHLYGSDPVP